MSKYNFSVCTHGNVTHLARKLNFEHITKFDTLLNEFQDLVYKYYIEYAFLRVIPINIQKMWNSNEPEVKKFIKTDSGIILINGGFNHVGVSSNSFPCSNYNDKKIGIDQIGKEKMSELFKLYTKKEKQLKIKNDSQAEIESVLLSLKTPTKIIKAFPELETLILKKVEHEVVVPVDSLRKKLGLQTI